MFLQILRSNMEERTNIRINLPVHLTPCAAISKEKTSEINWFQRFLVRVERFERSAPWTQITCATNCATPGYSVFAIIPWRRGEIKVFSVCSQLCGQSGFSGRFADPLQFRKRPCSKDFRTSATPIMDSNRRTPKCGALRTGLHPDILLSWL